MVSYQDVTLENGLRIVSAHLPFWRSLSLGVFAAAGSRHDPVARQGLAHFAEHMLFKGTRRRSPKRIVTQAESVGGSLNAYTSEEHTCYHVRSPAKQLKRMVPLLADMYLDSVYPEKEIERERQVIEDEIHMYRDEPASHIDDLLSEVTWPNHALGRPILGTLQSLQRISRADFLSHQERSYNARNSVVAIAGPQSHAEMEDVVAQAFGEMTRGRRRQTTPFRPNPGLAAQGEPLILEERPTEQLHLRLAFHTHGRRDPQIFASRLLSVLLGETMSSRLTQELREKRGYCYSIGCSRDAFQDTGVFTIYASFEPRFLPQMLSQIYRQLHLLRKRPPSKRELLAAYRYVAGSHEMGLEETSTQMFWLGDAALHQDPDLDPNLYLEELAAVTPEDVHRAAEDIFRSDNLRIALLGPDLNAQREKILSWHQAYL